MIDRRAFLQRTGAAAALLSTCGVSGAVAAENAPEAVTSEPTAALDPAHLFIGRLMAYDSQREAVVSNNFEFWTTAHGAAIVMDDGQGGERRSIVFDQPQVVWAFTCLARLMQSQGTYQPSDDR